MLNLSLPKRSVVQCGLAAVVSAMALSWLHIRPLGLVFLLLFGFWYYKTRCNLRIVPPPELQRLYERMTECLCDWRQSRPRLYCGVVSAVLAAMAIIGHLFSGSTVVLIGLVLAAIISTKYNFKIIKIEAKDFAWADKFGADTIDVDDEFLPEVNDANLFVLERASDLASIATSPTEEAGNGTGAAATDDDEEKSDEIPSDLLLLPDALPEIDEHTTDEEDELVPLPGQQQAQQKRNEMGESMTTTTSEVLPFKRAHFKRDSSLSSSSSEESLSRGLQFPDHTAVDGPALTAAGGAAKKDDGSALLVAAVKSQILPNLVSGLVQWSIGAAGGAKEAAVSPPPPPKPVANVPSGGDGVGVVTKMAAQRRPVDEGDAALSDESDFEMLENDDFK